MQTRLTGREFTVDVLTDQGGRLVGAVPRWRLETRGGISTKGRTFEDDRVIEVTRLTLAAVGIVGAANLQGFVTDDGDIGVIELNPRFSGGLPLSLAAGSDLVGEYVRGMFGSLIRPARLTYRSGVTMCRADHRGDVRRVRLLVPFGTRPEVVKLAPVVAALRRTVTPSARSRPASTTTGGSPTTSSPTSTLEPDVRWELPGDEAARVGALLTHAYEELAAHKPDAVLVLGDTHTVPLFGLAARRSRVPVVHLEAGLRSFNERSLEEVNRRTAAAIASLHLAPTSLAGTMLEAEGVDHRRVEVVGNPITDTLRQFGPPPAALDARHGVVVTAHRATNVDDAERLVALVDCIIRLSAEIGPVTFPVHPRTDERLAASGLRAVLERAAGVTLTPPLRYREMLDAVASARVVVTDSGGLQEEAAWLGVPVVLLRRSTPRWEGVLAGTTALVGLDAERAVTAARIFTASAEQRRIAAVPCPYGDGHVGERVAALLDSPRTAALLELREPDFGTGTLPALVAR